MAELLRHTATGAALHTDFMIRWALYGLAGLIVGYVLAYAGGMMAHTFAYRVICGVRLKVAEHIGKLPMGYVTNNSIGKTKQVLDADVEQIETFLAHQLPDFVSTIVMLLAMFIIMFSQNVWLAFSCLLPIVVGFVCQFAVMIKILKSGGLEENFDALEKISSSSIQYVQGMPSIKIFGQTVKSFRKFYEDIISYRDFTTKMTEVIRPGYVLFRMFVLSVATFIVPVGLLLFLKDPGDVAFVVTFLFFLILGPGAATPTLKLRSFSESMNVITEGVKRVDEVLNEKPLPEPAKSKAPAGYDISFHHVSFSYEAEGRKILNHVSFAAKQGEITALVGPSGAGKSTIAELIPRFWDVTEGSIEIGGVNIQDMSIHDLMEQMSFVFQESFLFSDTIFNNIALEENILVPMLLEHTSAAEMRKRLNENAELLGIKGILKKYPYEISGGEKQRTAIARALINNPQIILADEPTGNLDTVSAKIIMEYFAEINYQKKKAVVIVTHDPVVASYAKKIFFIKDGKIIKQIENTSKQQESIYIISNTMLDL